MREKEKAKEKGREREREREKERERRERERKREREKEREPSPRPPISYPVSAGFIGIYIPYITVYMFLKSEFRLHACCFSSFRI